MKSRERMPLVVGMLGILLILSTFVSTDTIVDLTGASSSDLRKVTVVSVTHDPIVIISDANFSATAGNEGWIGNGSAGNPYVIDGLDIDQGGAADNCISISNTRVNFTIQNCILTGASNPSSGIYLDNVMYGKIMNNTFFNNYFNIYIWNSHYLLVKNNTGTDSLYSISLRQGSSHNIITGNNVSYNTNRGINLESSSHDNLVINNTCNNNVFGIVLYQVTANSVDNNTFSNNVNDGIHINNANFNNFTKNLCRNNSRGVNLFGMSNNIKIENNTFSDNTNDGIYAEDAGSNYFTNNLFSNNGHGIFLYGNCDSYTITNNTCTGNSEGIRLVGYLGSGFPPVPNVPDNIDILWNIFTDNAANVIVSLLGINILFDYNFWSDYAGDDTDGNGVGDSPYTFTGNQDSHPLMAPPGSPVIWLQPPTDQILLIQVSFIYDLNASVYGGLDYWWINDTTNFAINQLGVVTNNTFLAADDYGLSVYVNDTHGNVLSGAFIVTISDVEAPIWIDLPTSRVLEIGLSLFYKMNASDISGLDHWWVNDTANFAIDSEGNIVNNTFLAVNGYGLHVWVNDTLGNTLDTTFMVSIIDTTNPTWITGPQDQELEEGYPYVFHLYVYDLSNIHKWWVNDTTHFTIDDYGMISNITSLAEGVYACEVKVNDTSGNILSGNFTLTIHEASPPNWDTIPINQIVEFGNGLYYDLDVTDFSDIDQWWLNDTTSFNIDQDGTITNSTPLAVGTYSILISVSDIVGYIQSHEITITVEDTTPPNWIETPIDQIVEFGEHLSYDLNYTDLSGIDNWWVDDTARFSIDWTGQIRTLEILDVGRYGLRIFISDIYGNTLEAGIIIEVVDTTPPKWTVSITNQLLEYGEDLEYQLTASDLSGISSWSVNDTTNFAIDNLGLITNQAFLEAGQYGLEITVRDPFGNELSAVMIVFVNPESTTITTTTTTTSSSTTTSTSTTTETPTETTGQTSQIPPEGMDPLVTLFLGVGIGGVAAIIIIIILLKKRS